MASYESYDNGTATMAPLFNGTTPAPDDKPYPVYVGYITAVVAVIMYGSNFVPIKKYYTGDGMFFQYVLCSGIFLVGVVLQLIRDAKFYPLVMVGGAIWATGNLCVVPIFKTIGMGLGMSTWGVVVLVTGWASGKFGWFYTKPDNISKPGMNYGGVALAFASIVLYVMVKNEVSGSTDMEITVNEEEADPLIQPTSINESHSSLRSTPERHGVDEILVFNKAANDNKKHNEITSGSNVYADDKMFIEDLSPTLKRIIGTVLSVFSGIMYGLNFTPTIYIQDNIDGASQNGLDYVFAQFCGIYVASSMYFYIYCAIKKNKPKVYPEVILPGIISGIMWAIATTCWFIANDELSEAVSFPIISTGPSAIASLFWGVVVFREIKGLRNILILVMAFLVMAVGVILAGLSR